MSKIAEVILFVAVCAAFATSQGVGKGRRSTDFARPQQPGGSTPADGQNGEFPAPRMGIIAANSDIHAALDTPLSSRTAHAGDRFSATILQPVRDSSGAALIPSGSRVMGEVTDEAPTAERGHSHLNLRFTEISLPYGQKVAITSSLLIGDKS